MENPSYDRIVAAVGGDKQAMGRIIQHYSSAESIIICVRR